MKGTVFVFVVVFVVVFVFVFVLVFVFLFVFLFVYGLKRTGEDSAHCWQLAAGTGAATVPTI